MTNLMQPRSPVLSPFRSSKLVTPAVSSKKERLIASLALVAGFNLIGYSEDVTKGFPLTLSSDSGSIPQDISRYETMVMSFEIPIDVTNGKFSINLTEKSGEKRSANILAEIDSETIKQIEPTSENYRIATLSVPLRHFPYVFHSWTPYWKDQMAFTKISTQNPVNTEEIESVSFQFSQPNSALQEARILLNSITFTGDLPTEKWVDRFGQNKTVDFTEKIVLDAELIENDKKEIVGNYSGRLT